MDPKQKIENIGEVTEAETDGSVSVDDFIKQLEAKEKDLHITADTTIIEIEESFDDANLPDFIVQDLQPHAAKPARSKAIAPATVPAPEETSLNGLEMELVALRDTISQLQTEREEILQLAQRRAKDFENFKSRTERERKETFRNQIGNLAVQMLPALDNLNRAVDFALAMPAEQRTEIQQFLDGVVLVSQQVNDVLAEMGVQPITTVGEVFDPHYHEAVATEEAEDLEPNTISAELLRGYRIGDHVIRHSMVKVVKGTGRDIEQEVGVEFDSDDEIDDEYISEELVIEDLPDELSEDE